MEIRYLDFTAFVVAVVSVLMVGCVMDSSKDSIVVEEQEIPRPPEPVAIEAPTEIVVEEPAKPAPEIVVKPEAPTRKPLVEQESVSDLLAKEPMQKEETWHEGVVIDIISSRPDYAVGTIRETKTFRRYKFTTDQRLQRWQNVRFKVNQYSEVIEITMRDANVDGEPDIVVREQGGTSLKRWEDGLRVMEGITERVRHGRNGKTYGFVKVHDGGFRQYEFATGDYFSNYERVEIKLDQEDKVIEIRRV